MINCDTIDGAEVIFFAEYLPELLDWICMEDDAWCNVIDVDCTGLKIVEREYFFDKWSDPDEIDVLARDETVVKVAEPFAAKVDSPFVSNTKLPEAVENFEDNFDLVEGGCASVEVK